MFKFLKLQFLPIFLECRLSYQAGRSQTVAKTKGKAKATTQSRQEEQTGKAPASHPRRASGVHQIGVTSSGWGSAGAEQEIAMQSKCSKRKHCSAHWGTMEESRRPPPPAHFWPERCIMQQQSSRKEPQKKAKKVQEKN